MKYTRYKLRFLTGVHLGKSALDQSNSMITADTLFSALYMEAIKMQIEGQFLEWTKQGKLCLTDAFPYIGNECYIPKPYLKMENLEKQGNSVKKKAFKKLSYIPVKELELYMHGKMDVEKEQKKINSLGSFSLRTSVAIHGMEKPEPYHVGIFQFKEKNGLYFIVGTETEEIADCFYDLLDALSFSGIGGKRSAGLGTFEILERSVINSSDFERAGNKYLLLTTSIPTEKELNQVIEQARYQLIKRGGFIQSETYADEPRKKKEMFFFTSGSCFCKKYSGDVFDVSDHGKHAVYRYSKPIFLAL